MKCPTCNATTPDESIFCIKCGSPIDPKAKADGHAANQEFRDKVLAIVNEQYKEQELVEVQTAVAIASRVSRWAKLFGFFLGLCLSVVVATLTFLGLKTFSDFSSLVKTQSQKIQEKTASAEEAERQIKSKSESFNNKVQRMEVEFAKRKKDLEKIDDLLARLPMVEARLRDVEKDIASFKFKRSQELTPEREAFISKIIQDYWKYLKKVGFKIDNEPPEIFVDSDVKRNAYYRSDTKRIHVAPELSKDPDVILREYSHHVLKPFFRVFTSVSSGLSDYFPCSFQRDPFLGEATAKEAFGLDRPYVRNLSSKKKFQKNTLSGIPQVLGEIWAGAFWEIRELLGATDADSLLLSTIKTQAQFDSEDQGGQLFVETLLRQANARHGEAVAGKIRQIFSNREFDFSRRNTTSPKVSN